jgi:hypothetical protein
MLTQHELDAYSGSPKYISEMEAEREKCKLKNFDKNKNLNIFDQLVIKSFKKDLVNACVDNGIDITELHKLEDKND